MGRHGITGEGDLPAGSVALKVLRASALPVMLVR
jgi:nucleotide-binding universal stress UspA family protein